MTTTLTSVATNRASDLDYGVPCGTCPDAAGEPRTATHVIGYGSTDLDGKSVGERLSTCLPCFGETYVWAETHNTSFVPPTVDHIPAPVIRTQCEQTFRSELGDSRCGYLAEARSRFCGGHGIRCPFCSAEYYACETNFRGICVKAPVAA